jgi:hypothetical protein
MVEGALALRKFAEWTEEGKHKREYEEEGGSSSW